jgi:hypothetical protein
VSKGDTWQSLFPDPNFRDMVMRLNRMNVPLRSGMTIAVPKDEHVTLMELSPFKSQIPPLGKKAIIVDPSVNAWGAYTADGQLVKWGPASAGGNYCPDIHRACHTISGDYAIYKMGGAGCISHKYPIETHGGAPTPYCMHFYKGFALHGSNQLPGYNASHGCVRLFVQDAQWINQDFADIGTRVLIVPYQGKIGGD